MSKHCYTFKQQQELRILQIEYCYASNASETKPRKGTDSSMSIENNITIDLQPENELKKRLGKDKRLDMNPEIGSTNGIVDEQVNASLSLNQTRYGWSRPGKRESEEAENTYLHQLKDQVNKMSYLHSKKFQTNLVDRATNQKPKWILCDWKNLDRSKISRLERATLMDMDYDCNDRPRQSGDHSRESDNDSKEEIANFVELGSC